MSNVVTIAFNGDPEDLIRDVKNIDTHLDKLRGEIDRISKASADGAKQSKISFTELRSAVSLVGDGFRYVQQALDATTGATVEYANEVRLLGQINGQTAESNSRLIQTLDDYKVSVDDITTASKKLKDNGLTPTIDTIATLAEKYQSIQDPAEKLKFAQDNLGKSSKAWLEVLKQSPEVLRQQAAGINENLILTQKQLDAARRLELAEDAKNDAMQELSVTIGNKLIPVQTSVIDGFNILARSIEIAKEEGLNFADASDKAGYEIWQEREAMLAMSEAADGASESTEDLAESQKEAEDAAKSLSTAYQGLLSSMFSIQGENESYEQAIKDLDQSDEDLIAKKNQLIIAYQQEVAANGQTSAGLSEYTANMLEVNQAIEANIEARANAAEDLKQQSEQRQYDLVQERLGADGLISSGEFEFLQDLAVQKGLVSRAAADQAIAESRAADEIVASFDQTNQAMSSTLELMYSIRAAGGIVPFGVDFQSNVPSSFGGYAPSGSSYDPQLAPGGYGYAAQRRDSGGWGMAGESYLIGTGAQPELFTPATNGNFTPAGKMGNTINITIGSIRSQADIDYLAQEISRRLT
jgi:hypothetical protein